LTPAGQDGEIVERRNQDVVQPIEEVLNAEAVLIEGQDRVDGKLTREVEHAAAAAVDPVDRPATVAKFLVVHVDLSWPGLPADGDDRRVFAEDQRDPVPIRGYLAQQEMLQGQRTVEFDFAQQVRAQRIGACAAPGCEEVEKVKTHDAGSTAPCDL
jgi:hypothetical protein